MKIRSLASLACVAVLLLANSPVWGGNSPQSEQNTQTALADTTRSELLMYFEEKDLVTATRRATPLRKAPAIATIITAEEIRNMGARNLLDVLKMVPGFGISINEDGQTMIEVRGIRTAVGEKILIMIDGHSLNRNGFGSSVWAMAERLPVENVKQVEIVRGPGSALYGNSAFLASINVITRDADDINGIEVKAGGGSFDSYKGNLTAGKGFGEKLAASGSVDYFSTHGAKLNVAQDVIGRSGTPDLGFQQTDAFMKIGYGNLSIRGEFRKVRKAEYIGLGYALADGAHQDTLSYWAEIAYNLRLNDNLASNLKVYYDHWEQNPFVKLLPNGFPGFPDGMIGEPRTKDRTVGSELQLDWDLFKGNHLILGAAYEIMKQYDTKQLANFDPLTFAPIGPVQEVANYNKNATREIFALYLQDEWQIFEKVGLTAGARYDHYSDFGDTTNPRVGLVWNVTDRVDLKLLYGQAFRAPSFTELYDINNPVVEGNPNLKPEKIRTYEAGLTYRIAAWLAADLNYFFSEITDLISWDTSTVPAKFANIGKAKTQGIEMGFTGNFGPEIYWKLNYAYQDPRDDITGQRLPYVPSNRASAAVNYRPLRYLNLHTDILWTGQRPRAQGDTRPASPSYTTVDMAATLMNFWKNLEIQATIHNLFDKRYSDPDTSGALDKVPGDFPREGISALLTATYKF